jgi:hypothetical protein
MNRSPLAAALLPSAALVAAGFVAFGLAWLGLSTETLLAQQVAWVVSGAMTGLGLIVLGVAMLALRVRRHNAAVELGALETAARDAREIAAVVAARRQ